jgi:hypothetical protein
MIPSTVKYGRKKYWVLPSILILGSGWPRLRNSRRRLQNRSLRRKWTGCWPAVWRKKSRALGQIMAESGRRAPLLLLHRDNCPRRVLILLSLFFFSLLLALLSFSLIAHLPATTQHNIKMSSCFTAFHESPTDPGHIRRAHSIRRRRRRLFGTFIYASLHLE